MVKRLVRSSEKNAASRAGRAPSARWAMIMRRRQPASLVKGELSVLLSVLGCIMGRPWVEGSGHKTEGKLTTLRGVLLHCAPPLAAGLAFTPSFLRQKCANMLIITPFPESRATFAVAHGGGSDG